MEITSSMNALSLVKGLEAQFDENDDVSLDENGEQVALTRPCTVQLEQAACDGGLQSFCCEYPAIVW